MTSTTSIKEIKLITFRFVLTIILLFPLLANADVNNNFLVISDIHLDIASTHTMEISPTKSSGENDLDLGTFKKLITELHENVASGRITKPNFIIILGDLVGHMRSSIDNVIASESVIFNELKINFPDTPIFYTFGNNDSLAMNYGQFKNEEEQGSHKSPYDIATLTATWQGGFLSTGVLCEQSKQTFPCIITEDINNGYYSAYLKPKLRMVTLNSVLFSPRRKTSQEDARQELQWLEAQLKTAAEHQENVLITMHIPPGNNVYDHEGFWLPDNQAVFLNHIKTYQKTIIGLLAGHTHTEEIKIIKDAAQNNIAGVFLNAGLSTSHGNEPSVKTFYFANQNSQWRLANYETFHFTENNNMLVFNKLYDYQSYYCHLPTNNILTCLNEITASKMKYYFTAENKNYDGYMNSPEDIVIQLFKGRGPLYPATIDG